MWNQRTPAKTTNSAVTPARVVPRKRRESRKTPAYPMTKLSSAIRLKVKAGPASQCSGSKASVM